MRAILLAGAAVVALSGQAQAFTSVTTSLFVPIALPGSSTVVGVQGIMPPSQAAISGPGYSVSFSGINAAQGVVQGTIPSTIHAVPVAGLTAGSPNYYLGDYGSGTTTNALLSGNYLSTGGTGTITITFTTAQTALAVLWGSVDNQNSISFNDAAGDVLTGAQVIAASGGVSIGGQGAGGSTYVSVATATPFTTVTFSSPSKVSFEFNAVVASTRPISTPEPMSLAMLGAGLLGLGLARRRS